MSRLEQRVKAEDKKAGKQHPAEEQRNVEPAVVSKNRLFILCVGCICYKAHAGSIPKRLWRLDSGASSISVTPKDIE